MGLTDIMNEPNIVEISVFIFAEILFIYFFFLFNGVHDLEDKINKSTPNTKKWCKG